MKRYDFEDLTIYFEGEIYKFEEYLINNIGEILKDLYIKYSFDFVSKLDGVFAFCIYDKIKNLYFCSRDRFGNIPFYYYIQNEKFIFSTSIKDILKELPNLPKLNKIALSKYIQHFSTFGEDTFYCDIYKLEDSSYLIFEPKKDLIKKKYYKINTYKAVNDENIALNDLEELLYSAIEKRLISSPSTLLSGGIDSSLISSIYTKISGRKIDTFSIGYNEYKNYCELPYAKITSNHINSNHHEIIIDKKNYIDSFYNTLEFFDEPHGDSAAVPLNFLLKNVKDFGVNSLLSGEGADELFFGYDNYAKFLKYYEFEKSLSNEQNLFLNDIIGALQNNTKESEYLRRIVKKQNLYNSFGEIYTDIQRKKLFKKVPTFKSENAKQDPVDWMSYIDVKIWLGEALLSKVDRISMGNSLEVRTPFLDFNLVNYMFSVESSIKVGDTNKYLLKKIASKYIPQTIINRTKKGFNSPFNEWLNKEYKDKLLDVIVEVNNETNLFNHEYILHIYELSKSNKFKQHLYSLFVFSLWYKKEFLS